MLWYGVLLCYSVSVLMCCCVTALLCCNVMITLYVVFCDNDIVYDVI